MESKLAGLDSRAELGKIIEGETLELVFQFPIGEFPFVQGRGEDKFPGEVVGPHLRRGEVSVVDGYFILGPNGLKLHAARFETKNGAFIPRPDSAVLRSATPQEYFDLEERVQEVNAHLRQELDKLSQE